MTETQTDNSTETVDDDQPIQQEVSQLQQEIDAEKVTIVADKAELEAKLKDLELAHADADNVTPWLTNAVNAVLNLIRQHLPTTSP